MSRQDRAKKFFAVTILNPKAFHLVSCIVFLILAVITLRAFLVGDALYIYRDDTWPIDLGHLISDSLNTFNLEATRRLIYLGPFFSLSSILGFSSLLTEKSLFIFTRFIIGFLPYLVTYKFLSSKLGDTYKNRIFVVSLIAGFFYAYNPFVTEKLGAAVIGFPISYALIPLIFYYFDKALNEKGFYNIFLTSILVSVAIAGTQQYLVWLPIFLLVPWFVLIVVQRIRSHKPVFNTVKNSLLVFLFFILISFYWVLMAVSITVTTGAPKPEYLLTEQMLNSFSSSTSLLNVIRLMGMSWPYVELTPIVDQSLWIFLTFVIPVGVILSVLLLRNKQLKFYSVSFFLIILVIMFFYKGTQQPEGWFYPLLYYIPVVGWMFRVPESNGMFLPFFVMMILSFGFYELLKSNKNRRIAYFKTIPVLILISSLVLLCWPMFTGDFGGIYRNQLDQPDISNNMNDDKQLIAPKENVAIVGGSDIAESIYNSRLIDPMLSSVFLSDKNDMDVLSRGDPAITNIVFDDGSGLLIPFLNENSTIIKPSDATLKHNPPMVWSKAGTDDPLHGEFHDYLDMFRMTNKDFDYGKGLVLTWGQDRLDIPFEVKANGAYDLYIRYLQNPEGGELKFYLDNNEIKEISTTDLLAKFVWESIGTFNLTKGIHKLALENIYGFNAANIFALIPTLSNPEFANQAKNIVTNVTNNVSNIASNTTGAAMTEANKLISPASSASANATNATATTLTQPETVLSTPVNDQSIFDLDFEGGGNQSQSIFDLDFERQNVTIFTMASRHFHSIIDNESSSLLTTRPISGNNSLRVDVKPSNDTTKWNTISTDFIPVNENAYYNTSLYISAKDVIQLHSKINYFDSNKKEIKSALISGGRSDTFEGPYKIIDSSPNGTKYLQLQVSSKSDPNTSSSYIIDNVKIEKIPFKSNNKKIISISTEKNRPISENNSLRVDVKPSNDTTKWYVISTDFIPVNENAYYNTSLYISAKDVIQLHSKINYFDSNKKETKSAFMSDGRNGTFEGPYNIVDPSPNGTKYMMLKILSRSYPNMPGSYLIDNIKIENVPLGQAGFTNNNNDILSISPEKNRPISGNNSLRVDVKPSNDTTKWNTISTDFIPVNENAYYNTSLYISAKDVIQLHSKINYFDSNKKEIKSAFMSERNGTFEGPYNIVDLSPNGTKYMKLQILSRSYPNMLGSYIIDNVKIENVPLGQAGFTNNNKDILFISTETANATNARVTTMTQPETVLSTPVNETANTTGTAKDILSTAANAPTNASGEEMPKANNVLPLASGAVSNVTQTAMDQENSFVSKKRIIYVLDGNSSFYNINHQIGEDTIIPKTNGTFERTFFKQLTVPNNSTQLSLQFSSKQNPGLASYYQIKGLEINPPDKKRILTSDFEVTGDLRKWKGRLNLSSEIINPISGMKSLRVDIPEFNNGTDWDVVRSRLIPVDENTNLNYQFSISPVDVNALRGKVHYHDEEKNQIGWDSLFDKPTPNGKYNSSYVTPEGTKYIQVKFGFRSNPEKPSYSLLDDVKVEQTTHLPSYNYILDTKASRVDMKIGNSSNLYIMQSKPIPIKENSKYNLRIDVKGQNLDSLEAKAIYTTSDIKNDKHVAYMGKLNPHSETFRNIKVLKTSNYTVAAQVTTCSDCTFLRIKLGDSLKEFSLKNDQTEEKWFYFTTNLTAGNNDLRVYSDGETNLYKVVVYPSSSSLALSPHSETFRNIKVLKTSNYTVAAQVTTCSDCTFLRIKLGDSLKEFSLKNDQTEEKWFYFTTNLTAGNNDLRVYSDGETNLYKVIIYSDSYKNETLSDLFDPEKVSTAVLSFDKIDPSHYQARVNATKPFVLKFTGPYNPAWIAYVSGNQYSSVKLYPDTNGFFIPETGELAIKIEYQSQKWFYVGSLVTISTILGSVCYLALERRDAIRRLLRTVVSSKPRLIWQNFNQPKLTKYRDIMILNLKVHNFIKPQFPIFIALVILMIMPFLLVQQQIPFANELMVYAYMLLVVGAIWYFVLYLKNNR